MKSLHLRRLWFVLFSTLVLVGSGTILVRPDPSSGSSTPARVVIEGVYYDGLATGEPDEAVQLVNLGADPVDLAGWSLNDSWDTRTRLTFPLSSTAVLAPGERIWIAREAAAFTAQFGFAPDWTASAMVGSWIGLANSGDEVVVRDADLNLVDVLVYAGGDPDGNLSHWSGPALMPYKINRGTAVEGQILYRKRDPASGQPLSDTNTAADWAQDSADVLLGRKIRYPGWDLDQFFQPFQVAAASTITVIIAPDHAYEALAGLIDGAAESLQIQSHTFENIGLAQRLAAAAGRGVAVDLLLEGGPPGGVSDQQRAACQILEAAGGACWVMMSDAEQDIRARYDYLHAKFMLIDRRRLVIGSENLSPNSLPADPKGDGTWGRRGVFLATDAPPIVAHFQAIWAADFDRINHRDIWPSAVLGGPPPGYRPPEAGNGITYTVRFPLPADFTGVWDFTVVQSPENSLHPAAGLLELIGQAGAGDHVLVQQLVERPYWGATGSNPIADPNLRLEAYLAAARRGASVWLLLDDYFDRPAEDTSNAATCRYLEILARLEQIDLRCQTGNPAGLGIHNKMILVQAGGRGYIHIGSINGSEQSHKGNREAALQIQSDDLYDYLAGLFFQDWTYTLFFPTLPQQYIGPASYPLITEVLVHPLGLDGAEFVEIANPTDRPVDLSGYALSDAVSPADFADSRRFPQGTVLAPGQTVVVAQQGSLFQAQFGIYPDFEILDSVAVVPNLPDDPAWGDPAQFFQLGNSGDIVFLRDRVDGVVDLVGYGDKGAAGQPGCALAPGGHSLRRRPYWRDTNNCTEDFEPWPSPDPGLLPAD